MTDVEEFLEAEDMLKALLKLEPDPGKGDTVTRGGTQQVAAILAELADLELNPTAISLLLSGGYHPLEAANFAAFDANGVRRGWPQQHARLVEKYVAAKEVLDEAQVAYDAVARKRDECKAVVDELRRQLALMRVLMTARSFKSVFEPLAGARQLLAVLLAVLGDSGDGEGPGDIQLRRDAKAALAVLGARVADEDFRTLLGQAVRGFALAYEDEASKSRGKLDQGVADALVKEWSLSGDKLAGALAVLRGEESVESLPSGSVGMQSESGDDEQHGVDDEDDDGLPF